MSSESNTKNILVVLGVCIVCSILVSTAAVSLHSIQEANKTLDKSKNILAAGDLLTEDVDIEQIFKDKIRSQIIELSTGNTVPEDEYTDVLHPGDCIYYDSTIPHRVQCSEGKETKILAVIYIPTEK